MVQIHGIRRASADAKYRQMTGQPVKPLILKLCLPAVISNLVTTAYNLTDTFFIGQLGTAQSGAIGIAFSIMTVMQALGFFFGNGAGNSMSRELGKQNNERASRLLAVGFAGAVLSGLVIATIGLLTLRPLVVMLGSTSTIAPYAVQYLTPLLVAAPCVCGSFALNGLLRYQGQSTFGMIGLVSGALLNFLLAPLFIFVLHLGIFGAGLATAICQTVSFTILTTMSRKFGVMKLSLRNCKPDMLLMREVAGGGLPSLIRQGAGSISVTCVNIAANPFGDAAIAGMAIVMRIMLGANSVIVGLGQGFQPVCGYNYGAGLFARVKEGYWFCVRLATCVLVALAALLWIFRAATGRDLPFRPSRGGGGRGRAAYSMLHGDSQWLQHDGQYDDPDHGPHRHRLVSGLVPARPVPGTDCADSADDIWRAWCGDGAIGVRRADIRGHHPVHAANPARIAVNGRWQL